MKEISADMAGMVLNILVNVGDKVSEGQDVITLESMKMEVMLQASNAGFLKEIKVSIGDFVNEGDVLFVLE